MDDLFKVGQKVRTNDLYFSRYHQIITGEIINIEGEKVWIKNQHKTISIIDKMCIENEVNILITQGC